MTMPAAETPYVRPDVATFLKNVNSIPGPKLQDMTPEAARAMGRQMLHLVDVETGPLAVIRDLAAPGPAGPIPLRLFDARTERAPGPVLVFYHGGGWVLGDLDTYAALCAALARGLDMPVVSVDYRLAPEHPWPAAPEDAIMAARWIATAPAELGVTPTALALAGDSAGGNLTIVTAIALRETPAALPVIAQWAMYPAADIVTHYPSFSQFADGYFLTREGLDWFMHQYLADPKDWRASPMEAALAGLPPALVTTASLDPIRDQGRAYAAGLANAGVPVTFREANGNIHGYLTLRRMIPSADADLAGEIALFRSLLDEASR